MALVRELFGALLGGRADAARKHLAHAIGDEPLLLGPAPANYRGSNGRHPRVKGNGTLALTPTRLLFRKVVGGPVDVDLSTVSAVSTAKTFVGSFADGQTHLVLHTPDGDLAWFVQDLPRWHHALEAALVR